MTFNLLPMPYFFPSLNNSNKATDNIITAGQMTFIKTITFLFLKKHIAINRYVIVDLHNIFFDNEAAVSDFSIICSSYGLSAF